MSAMPSAQKIASYSLTKALSPAPASVETLPTMRQFATVPPFL